MEWYQYIACFFSGMFFANAVPHFVSGISGNKFPSPFAKPPGKGLSSAPVNVIWGLFNILVGFVLYRAGHVSSDNIVSLIVFFLGITFISISMSRHFQHKDRE